MSKRVKSLKSTNKKKKSNKLVKRVLFMMTLKGKRASATTTSAKPKLETFRLLPWAL
jgi:ABC-type hemin transport system substrate-binding protein